MNKEEYINSIKKVIITEEQIREKVKEAGKYVESLYDGKPVLLISILNGSFVFAADLMREINVPCEIAFMAAKSYVGSESSGNVEITLDIDKELSEYNVVVAEDIVDTGRTLKEVTEILKSRNPHSFKVVTLLDKPDRRAVEFKADYVLFQIPNVFIVGYGLDYNDYFRNLPYIAEL